MIVNKISSIHFKEIVMNKLGLGPGSTVASAIESYPIRFSQNSIFDLAMKLYYYCKIDVPKIWPKTFRSHFAKTFIEARETTSATFMTSCNLRFVPGANV